MHKARKFRLVFCVDVYGCMVDAGMRLLESVVRKEEEEGGFGYLVSSPVIVCERRMICTRATESYPSLADEWVFANAL